MRSGATRRLRAGHRGGAAAGRRGHAAPANRRQRARRARSTPTRRDHERPLRGADRALDAGRAHRGGGPRGARRACARRCARPARRPSAAACTPTRAFGDVEHVAASRYQAIRDAMRGLVARTPTAALHVHVGMPDPETAIDVCNRLRAHLPLLQALAAHSPYWHGQRLRLRHGPLDGLPRVPALDRPAGVRRLGPLRRLRGAGRGGGRGPGLHVPVVGHAPEPAAWARSRCARWTRRAGSSRSPASPRSCTRSRWPAPTATRSRCRRPRR